MLEITAVVLKLEPASEAREGVWGSCENTNCCVSLQGFLTQQGGLGGRLHLNLFFAFCFLGPYPRHMEVPRLGVK